MTLQKGDILRATHGVIEGLPVTYIFLKDKNIKEKLEKAPNVVKTGEDPNGDLWIAIPKKVALKDFLAKAPVAASFRKSVFAKYQIQTVYRGLTCDLYF